MVWCTHGKNGREREHCAAIDLYAFCLYVLYIAGVRIEEENWRESVRARVEKAFVGNILYHYQPLHYAAILSFK